MVKSERPTMTLWHGIRALVLGLVITTGTAVSSASSPAKQSIKIIYDPTDHEVTLVLPTIITDVPWTDEKPIWLEHHPQKSATAADESVTVFAGIPPGIDAAEGGFGAGDNGAFLFGVLDWLPDLPEFAPTGITLETPITHGGLATSELISESTSEQRYIATFGVTEDWRTTDVFFGPYEVRQRSVALPSGEVALRTYFRPEEQEFSDAYLDAVATYITRYSDELGQYPYKSFSVVSAPIPVGYALDGMTYISQQILGHPYMLGRSLAHEVLHSWWGSGVEIDYADGNWAEGLTTYHADYTLAVDRDADAAKSMRREWLAALTSLPDEDDLPLREFRSAGHGRDQSVGYGKSAMVFHMLRNALGSSVYEEGLRRFWQENEGKTARWTDIQYAFETVSDRDLGAYFEQWLDRKGLPEISLDGASVKETANGYSVAVQLSQSGDIFAVEFPILVETVSSEIREAIFFSGTSETFAFNLSDQPLSVSVDPDFDALRILADGELPSTIRDILRAEATVVVVGEGAENSADSLLSQLLRNSEKLQRVETGVPLPPADAVIAIGVTDEIVALRAEYFHGPPPSIAKKDAVRAWAETDDQDTDWLFISSDDLGAISDELSALRYYANQSFVSLKADARPSMGRWPVENSPMKLSLK